MVVTPYTDYKITERTWVRTFAQDTSQSELVWHRDHEQRCVHILKGTGWQLQMDNRLPELLREGDHVTIPANTYHRLIKGQDVLVVEIIQHEADVDRQ